MFCIALIALIAIGFFSSCGNPWMDKALKPLFGPSYKIGDTGPGGGIVFYYDPVGFPVLTSDFYCHYLEVAFSNPIAQIEWALPTFSVMTNTGIGDGFENTMKIIEEATITFSYAPAAEYCRSYGDGWYLPSKMELDKLYEAKDKIGLPNHNYWSSSEFSFTNAYYLNYNYGTDNASKTNTQYVLPIRAF